MAGDRPDPSTSVRAAVAGAPQRPPIPPPHTTAIAPKVAAALTKTNTKTTGYLGVALVLSSYVVPAIAPDVDKSITGAHVAPIVVHGLVAAVGAIAALLGRWKCFADDPA